MDDGCTILANDVDDKVLLSCLNNLHPDIKFTMKSAKTTCLNGNHVQTLNFLDIEIILYQNGKVETNIYYKPTNSHKYLDYTSFHPEHSKNNIPFALAKRIIVFVTDDFKMEKRLEELTSWLVNCGYPTKIIKRGIHNARLQGPAPPPKDKKNTIPFLSTYRSNLDISSMTSAIRNLLASRNSPYLTSVFQDLNIVNGYRQPKSLRKLLTKAQYTDSANDSNVSKMKADAGLKRCTDKRCKLCRQGYIQETNSFETANKVIWKIKSNINCNSEKLCYYLTCNMCEGKVTYTGKTKNALRIRMNNHISSCKTGNGSNMFDNHVYKCGLKNGSLCAPYFKIYVFMKLSKQEDLILYEKYLHSRKYDTMNTLLSCMHAMFVIMTH